MKTRRWLVSSLIAVVLALGTVWAVDGKGSCPAKDSPCAKQEKDKSCDKQKCCCDNQNCCCDKDKAGCPQRDAGAPKK